MESPESSSRSWRISASLLGALVGAEIGVLWTAFLVARATHVPFLPISGLLSPLGVFVASGVALWTLMFHGATQIPSLREFLQYKHRRWGLILSGPGVIAAWWAVGQLSLRLLVAFHERPLAGGALMATSSLGCFVLTAWLVSLGATALCRTGKSPSLRTTILLSVGGPIVFAAALILAGSTSGVGSPWALFGVFKREELELSPVWELLQIVGFSYVGALVTRKWAGRLVYFSLGAVALATMFVSLLAASKINFRHAVQVERAPGLSTFALRGIQKLSDVDGDGYSAKFGGGDCNDARREVSPRAKEIPDNGVDENCSGSDLTLATEPSKEVDAGKAPATELPQDANFLLLTIDTLRFDLGYARAEKNSKISPNLDQLATRSTVFERAYSLASYTSKSLGPMMIGRYPSETARTFEHFDRFPKTVPFVQQRLQNAGIRTVSVQGYWYFFLKSYGFERGWDILDSTAAPKAIAIEGDKTSNGDELADAAIAQLETLAKDKSRFFMWTHWVDPHAEYVAHKEFDYGAESRERYDGEVSFVDAQVGRILESLDRLSLDENTVILVTSDHGEAFGEHGLIRHGFEVWEELVRVPLILHVPGVEPRVVNERRSLIDVTSTILDQFKVEVKESEDEWLRGTSLFRDVLAARDERLAVRPVLVDMPEGPNNKQRQAFYSGDLKLIVSGGRALGLYDLAKDPGEKLDLSQDKQLLAKMREELDRYLSALRDVPASR